MIVDGFASVRCGMPRTTGDLDFWVQRDEENARRILAALDDFGMGDLGIQLQDLLDPDMIIQLGYPPARADILTFVTGLDFEQSYSESELGDLGGIKVPFISKEDLLRNKSALGRPQDLSDVSRIRQVDL